MSFEQGLSGLNAAAKNLDVIGNNVANSSTTGFKQGVAIFGDVFAASLGGGVGSEAGIGTQIQGINQQFSQGAITVTNNPLDVAINGQGFYRTSNNGEINYCRNGGFSLDKNGFIVTSGGQNLTGFQAVNGTIVPGTLVNLQLNANDLSPMATSTANVGVNLSSNEPVIPTSGLDVSNPKSYNFSTASSCFDSLGKAHTMTFYFNKVDVNQWDSSVYIDGVATTGGVSTLTFSPSGAFVSAINPVQTAPSLGGADTLSIKIDYSATSQFGSNFSVNSLAQNGFASGSLSGYNIGPDGIIVGRYNNGQVQKLGQIALTNFTNAQGLAPVGNGMWVETAASGVPLTGTPGTSSLGVMQSSAREDSNVDLTAELVNMITAQRVYQANAQSIKVQDSLMQTMVSLR